jgi:hypothetical protein
VTSRNCGAVDGERRLSKPCPLTNFCGKPAFNISPICFLAGLAAVLRFVGGWGCRIHGAVSGGACRGGGCSCSTLGVPAGPGCSLPSPSDFLGHRPHVMRPRWHFAVLHRVHAETAPMAAQHDNTSTSKNSRKFIELVRWLPQRPLPRTAYTMGMLRLERWRTTPAVSCAHGRARPRKRAPTLQRPAAPPGAAAAAAPIRAAPQAAARRARAAPAAAAGRAAARPRRIAAGMAWQL